MKILIVDDESHARRRLASLIEQIGGDLVIVGEASSGIEALELTPKVSPDVLLLDIAMPEVDGFDVLRHLPQPRPLVILQTAYHEHALRAFEHEALDYLVKPVAAGRLSRALDRAREQIALRAVPASLPSASLRRLGAQIGHRSVRPARLLVRFGQGHRLIAVSDIVTFVADDGMVYAETDAGRFGTDYTLNELDERMGGTFVRVNRGQLVNVARVEGISSNGDGSATLTAAGGTVHVSRRRAAAVRKSIEK
jgi:DNA-binding LytR/AlgR family response regulator